MDINELLKLDKHALDVECEDYASRYYKFAEASRKTAEALGEAQLELKEMKAELGVHIRRNPHEFGIEKLTVDAVADAITTHQEVKTLERQILDLTSENEKAENARKSLDKKGSRISNLIDLFTHDYYASAGVDRTTDVMIEKISSAKAEDSFRKLAQARENRGKERA